MHEGPPQNSERHHSEQPTLFERLGPDDFVRHLESVRVRIQNREDGTEQRLEMSFPAGEYDVAVSFPKIDPNDKRFFYGNLPTNKQESALELDTHHPSFQMLRGELVQSLQGKDDVASVVPVLKTLIERRLQGDLADEHVGSLSEIIQKGHTACAGMVSVAGVLLKTVAPKLSVTAITGSPLKFNDKMPVNFHHEWLRISDGKRVALYDPLYKHLEVHDLSHPTTGDEDVVGNYQVYAWGASSFAKGEGVALSSNIKFVMAHDNTGNELWLQPDDGVAAQIFGEISFGVRTPGATMTLVNGTIELSRNPANRASGRHLIPIIKLDRRSE